MMNPKMLMQMKSLLTKFRQNHESADVLLGSVPCDQRGQCDRDQFDYGRGKRTLHQYACDPGRSGNGADSGGDGIEVSIY